MPVPGVFVRVLAVAAILAAGVVAAVGGLALRPPGVVAVGVAGLLAGLTAAAIARDAPGHSFRRTVEAAAIATAATVGVLLVVSGTAALVGGAGVALLLLAVAAVWLGRVWFRTRRGERAAASRSGGEAVIDPQLRSAPAGHGARAAAGPDSAASVSWLLPPVAGLSTAALGDEWVHTTAALAGGWLARPQAAAEAGAAPADKNARLAQLASNTYPIRTLFKRRTGGRENPGADELKKQYGELTLLDFPQFTKDHFPGVTKMDVWSSLFGDVTDSSMYAERTVTREGRSIPVFEFDPSTPSSKKWLDQLAARAGVEIKQGANPLFRRCRINRNGYEGIWAYEGAGGSFEYCDLTGNTRGVADISADSRVKRVGCRE